MNVANINRLADRYARLFKTREFGKSGREFIQQMRTDMDNAGFEFDDLESYRKIYPGAFCDTELKRPERLKKINNIQTLMNTIHTEYRYACRSDGYTLFTPWVTEWFAAAFKRLAELTEKKG